MSRTILALAALWVFGLLMVPAVARAQMGLGSPSASNPIMHYNDQLDDSGRRAGKHSDEDTLRDAAVGIDDASPKVRLDTLKKLRFVRDPKVTEFLMRGLADPDTRVKVKAVDILGARQTTDAVPTLGKLLFMRSTEQVARLHIAAALGRIGDARGTLPVMQYLERSSDERSRGTAVFALGEIADTRASQLLTKTATDDPSPTVRRLAQEALEKVEGELPSQRSQQTAKSDKKLIPTDQQLSRLREVDAKIHSER